MMNITYIQQATTMQTHGGMHEWHISSPVMSGSHDPVICIVNLCVIETVMVFTWIDEVLACM